MKIWKILSPKVLTAEERPDNITTDTQAKVKVTRLLFSENEARAYIGTPRPKYPVVPGRFAVGVVAETGKGCLRTEKNTRVYIHDVIPCGECARCRAGDAENCASMRAAGTACEGYLRDFVVTDESNLSPLPLSVSDDEALFIGIVSLCEAVIDRLRVGKGDHIAVFGGREMGNILCQLLIYHQAVPIFVDPDDGALALAAQCGIYYTVRADQAMEENICRITGGRLAKDSVYFSGSDLSPSLPFAYTAAAGTEIYTGFDFPDVTVAVRQALEKRLTVTAVTNDYSNNSTAINLIVNKAINLAPFRKDVRPVADIAKLFEEAAARREAGDRVPYTVVNMI